MNDAEAQARAAGRLAGWAFDGAVRGVSRVHRQIAERAFDSIGPSAESARRRHDAVSALAYAGVRGRGGARCPTPPSGGRRSPRSTD